MDKVIVGSDLDAVHFDDLFRFVIARACVVCDTCYPVTRTHFYNIMHMHA